MLVYQLPQKTLIINHLVLDFNGTLACNGRLLPGVLKRLQSLSRKVNIYILTADTFGTAVATFKGIPVNVIVVDKSEGGVDKERTVVELGVECTAALGNGFNDALMLKKAALGILVIGPEGAAVQSLLSADVVFTHINDAFDFLLNPSRVVATLRP